MPRPYRRRRVKHSGELFYKPAGIRMVNIQNIAVEADEYEAIRLADLEGFSHEDAGKQMGISRQTFGRIIEKARKKVADALVNGKSLSITKNGPVEMIKMNFVCVSCGHRWKGAFASSGDCPECGAFIPPPARGPGDRFRHGRGRKGDA